ncbi:MAG TPA: leucyl/phenylalanyl-tRNA--protein transferase [Methyloceanibacter sp.]|nr:leucyl/phenylalanyl-tRNA--protein transferase [Methyloceanibacter sp.]
MNLINHRPELAGLPEPKGKPGAEGIVPRIRRAALALLWTLKPPRLWGVPGTLWVLAKHYAGLKSKDRLPDPERALRHPDGLAGICTDLSAPTLLAAYRKGLFPLAHIGPQKWWAPAERMVSFPGSVHISKHVRRLLRNKQFRVTFDSAFGVVIRACAEPRPGKLPLTWIRPDIIEAYEALYEAGYAHSVEVWDRQGNLAGGLYGVAIGKAFITESMFARRTEASKVAFVVLSCHLQHWGFRLNDGKRYSEHLRSLGFRLIPRREFNTLLAQACSVPARPGHWSIDPELDVAQWEPQPRPGEA